MRCKACDKIKSDFEELFDEELCIECWQIAINATYEDFDHEGKNE